MDLYRRMCYVAFPRASLKKREKRPHIAIMQWLASHWIIVFMQVKDRSAGFNIVYSILY
jgi:hypothetical protein